MNDNWLPGALALAITGGALLGAGCGGERPSEAMSAEVIATTELASLSIEGMT